MSDAFFENKGNKPFKPLNPQHYTPPYRQYVKEEAERLAEILKGAGHVLEAGVGIGRTIPHIAPHVEKLTGIDQSEGMLAQARKAAKGHPNVDIIHSTLEEAADRFPAKHFDLALCLWNTIGNVKSDTDVLKALARVSRRGIVLTVHAKGNLEKRREYHAAINAPIARIDSDETIHTANGLISRAYSEADLHRLAASAGLRVKDLQKLAGVMWMAVLEKKRGAESSTKKRGDRIWNSKS